MIEDMGSAAATLLAGHDDLRSSAALLPPDEGAGILIVTGPDREKFMQAMLTQQVVGLAPGQGREAAVLDREGRILASFALFILEDRYVLRVEEGRAEALKAFLDKFKIAAKVEVFSPSPGLTSLAVGGPLAQGLLEKAWPGFQAPDSNLSLKIFEEGYSLRWDRFGFPLLELWMPAARHGALDLGSLGTPVSAEALLAYRIENRRPFFHSEDKGLIPNDLPQLEDIVSFSKGCFPGQEVVIRIKHRGQPGHRLAVLKIEGEKIPEKGSSILHQGQEAGRVMAAGYCPGLGGVGVMALLKRVPGKLGSRLEVQGFGGAEVVR